MFYIDVLKVVERLEVYKKRHCEQMKNTLDGINGGRKDE